MTLGGTESSATSLNKPQVFAADGMQAEVGLAANGQKKSAAQTAAISSI